jgi:hypothetical protein
MNNQQKEPPTTNINLVRQTLEEEGCPQAFINELLEYFNSHPKSTVRELGQCLDNIACRFGHLSYHSFRRADFQQHGADPLLVSWV